MMEIKKTGINYHYADDGVTVTRVDISYSAFGAPADSLTATSMVTSDMLADGATFDDVTAKDLDKLGRAKIAGWFADVTAAPAPTVGATPADEAGATA